MIPEVYKKPPISFVDDIPVFSTGDRFSENYERIASDHLKVFEEDGLNPFQAESVRIECEESTAALLRQYARDGDAVLDVGCGMGTLLERFASVRRWGMDISTAYLKHAKQRGVEVCWARIEDMPYLEESFDVVTCTDVLEHVLDLNACFVKILSVVKPGGFIIVRVPYNESLKHYLDPSFPYEWVHLRRFDEWSLRLFVEKTFGCSVVEETFAGYRAGVLRFGRSVPKAQTAVSLLVDRLQRSTSAVGRPAGYLWRKLFAPTVINVVVRKPVTSLGG